MKAPFFAVALLMATASLAMAESTNGGNGDKGGPSIPPAASIRNMETQDQSAQSALPGHPGCADPRVVRTEAPGLYRSAPSDLPSSGAPTTPPTRTAFDACK